MKKKIGIVSICMMLVTTLVFVIPAINVSAAEAPNADFNFTPNYPANSDVIQFNDLSTDSDGHIVQWWWDFGDGYYSNLQNPVHCYYTNGVYTVTLMVTDNTSNTDSTQKTIHDLTALHSLRLSLNTLNKKT